ncbi:MAG: hypothetical protein CVV02_14555 [Firmicutes bacterium HGW-Firmicutes-7]|nr:MAG: hypothetical protein CVV02_14555 [Firmicutes bacterium HGW-Firmicutes-7]
MKKKFQVFVSSTYLDMKEERQAAVEAILEAGHIPAGMELFTANNEAQLNVIHRWIDSSDVFLLLFGGRYGSLPNNSTKSYIHLEYEYAMQLKKPIFTVAISNIFLEQKVSLMGTSVIELKNRNQYDVFKTGLYSTLLKEYNDYKDIKYHIQQSLKEYGDNLSSLGWIREEEYVALKNENVNYKNENSKLYGKILDLEFYASLLKCDDVGKSLIIDKILNKLSKDLSNIINDINDIDDRAEIIKNKLVEVSKNKDYLSDDWFENFISYL